MSSEVEWCLDGDPDGLEGVWVGEDIPSKHLRSLHLDKVLRADFKVKASAVVASVEEVVVSEVASVAIEAASVVTEEVSVVIEEASVIEEAMAVAAALAIRTEVVLAADKVDLAVVLRKALPVDQVAEAGMVGQMATMIDETDPAEVGTADEINVVRLAATENLLADATAGMATEIDTAVAGGTRTKDQGSDTTKTMATTIRESGGTRRVARPWIVSTSIVLPAYLRCVGGYHQPFLLTLSTTVSISKHG